MAFTILHPTDAIEDPSDTFPQAQWDRKDIEIIVAGFSNVGVVSGCEVTAQGTPTTSVHVAAGTVMVGGSTTADIVSVSAGDVSLTAAHATLPRFDLVVASDAGALSAVTGTAATTPVFPAIPADRVVLAAVYHPAADTAVETAQIVDKRMPLPTPPAATPFDVTVKQADETVSASTTLQDDLELFVGVVASEVVDFELVLYTTQTAAGNLKVGWTVPSGTTIRWGDQDQFNGAADLFTESATNFWTLNNTGTRMAVVRGRILAGGTPGNVQLQWAQNTATGTTTVLRPALKVYR